MCLDVSKVLNHYATDIFFKNIGFLLANNVSLIAEAAFQHHVWEPEIMKLNERAEIFVLICEVDAETAAKHHLQRGLKDPKREFYHGDNRVVHYKKTGEILPTGEYKALSGEFPTTIISTLDGYNPSIEEVSKKVGL